MPGPSWLCGLVPALFAALLLFTGPAQSAEPVFRIKDMSAASVLAPEKLPITFYNFQPDEFWAEPEDSWWMEFSTWVIHQERRHGPTVQSFGAWADQTVSGSSTALPANQSYLRLGFAAESEYSDLAQFEPEMRFRLDVPTAEKKLRLVVESESEELVPLAERERDRQLTEPERTDTNTTGALRFLTAIGDAINLSTDIGGRLRLPPELFWRTTAQKRWEAGNNWNLQAKQRLYYYHTKGYGGRTWFGAGRPFVDGWYYSNTTELEWIHRQRRFELAHIHSLRKRLDDRSVLTPRLGVLGESKPSWRTTAYFVDLTWRYRMYDDWLYAELIPALEFPRDRSFGDQPSFIFRIEMYFSGTIDRR
ncbi:hypothetical protein C7H09_11365 [Marinobacter fuscus]|uniref:DUF3187 domain-containing protein n=1 Tax=Marinobacter fuscus TaxID=2109942 RepID=A0A2T1K706_9GAMM|nr:hypothetical protein [Marinobacter fuscus]PSF05936.1 hypothetical protein C7H09_11365 [Marinobacter fuscus]